MSKFRRVTQGTILPYYKRLQGMCHLCFFIMLSAKKKKKSSYVLHHEYCMTATSLSKIHQGLLWGLDCLMFSSRTHTELEPCK